MTLIHDLQVTLKDFAPTDDPLCHLSVDGRQYVVSTRLLFELHSYGTKHGKTAVGVLHQLLEEINRP